MAKIEKATSPTYKLELTPVAVASEGEAGGRRIG